MRLKLPVSATVVSPDNGHRTSAGPAQPPGQPLNAATRYLSAAAHLRKAMLPAQLSDATRFGTPVPRVPHPVGRSYALRVLWSAAGEVSMPAVDLSAVKRNCHAAVRQTLCYATLPR